MEPGSRHSPGRHANMETFSQIIIIFAKWPAVVAMGSALVFFIREYKHHPKLFFREVSITAITTFIAWGISAILKVIVAAPRPFVEQGIENIFMVQPYTSFPSGHATMFFALATAIFLYNRRNGLLLYSFATVIVIARVIAGIHYPIDVIAGALIGIVVAFVAHRLLSKVLKNNK